MKHKLIIGSLVLVLFLALGLGYAFLPFEAKTHYNITFSLQETGSMILGFIIAFLGLVSFVLILSTDALKRFRKYGKKYWWTFLVLDITKWIIIIAMGYFLIGGGVGISQSILK